MQIEVKLIASLQVNRFKTARYEMAEAAKIEDLADHLGINTDNLGLIMLNGKSATLDMELKNGDTITLFPVVGGG